MSQRLSTQRIPATARGRAARCLLGAGALLLVWLAGAGRAQQVKWSDQERPIADQLNTLRRLPDDVRARTTRQLALEIRKLPAGINKLRLANGLANLSTEGDFGRETLQEVAATLAGALGEHPMPEEHGRPATPYLELATLARYEHVEASLQAPQFAAALAQLEADDRVRQRADFTLADLQGQRWTLKALRGQVVVVNFWATWCPPCRREIPDLENLYQRFQGQGLVILGISDEAADKVSPFVASHGVTYPVLLDSGREVHRLFAVEGIPQTFVYDRAGKLVAEALDMRTQTQFLKMLAQAGLK